MPDDDSSSFSSSLFDRENTGRLLSLYKFPMILGLAGIVFLGIAIILLLKNQFGGGEVTFSTEASPSAQVKIRVDIAGEVLNPGVYELPEGTRIADALAVAGGLSVSADRDYVSRYLNRAAKLIDGAKIYIPKTGETTSSKTSASLNSLSNLSDPSRQVNLNTASQTQLEVLPGVGPVTAGKIIAGRPYQTVEELKSRKIIGTSLYEKLKDLLSVY